MGPRTRARRPGAPFPPAEPPARDARRRRRTARRVRHRRGRGDARHVRPQRPGGRRRKPWNVAESAVRQQARASGAARRCPRVLRRRPRLPLHDRLRRRAARRTGAAGWPAVDRLLAQPPTSTAALLHPDRPGRTGRRCPAAELPPVPDGWEEVLTDSVGEWGLAFLLGRRHGRRPMPPPSPPAGTATGCGWSATGLTPTDGRWRGACECRTVEARRASRRRCSAASPRCSHAWRRPGRLSLTWVAAGRTLEVRATWPQRLRRDHARLLDHDRLQRHVSRSGPTVPVWTAAIASTTPIPSTTLPNTQ